MSKSKIPPGPASQPLQEILDMLRIPATWDALFVGDGSGWSWKIGAGWAVTVIDRHDCDRTVLSGGLNMGTVGLAELFPYLHALLWYHATRGPRHLADLEVKGFLRIHVISDSEIVCNQGNGLADKIASAPIWAAIHNLKINGYVLQFHHCPRNVIALNAAMDVLSKAARLANEDVTLAKIAQGVTAEDFNPGLSGNRRRRVHANSG